MFWEFEVHTDHLIPARKQNYVIIYTKQKIYLIGDFAVSGDPRVKIKEKGKRYKYLDLARDLKKSCEAWG